MQKRKITHEDFVQAVRKIVVRRVEDDQKRDGLVNTKLTYGVGQSGIRGITYYGAWKNGKVHDFVGINAIHEESLTQLAGTTIHELGHVLAGPGAGHGSDWRAACKVLGLSNAEAGGQEYKPESFESEVWNKIEKLGDPVDGAPDFRHVGGAPLPIYKTLNKPPRPCPLGVGTRGGKSRGVGSGSRLRKYVCDCGIKVRVASDDFRAHCDRCGGAFTLN